MNNASTQQQIAKPTEPTFEQEVLQRLDAIIDRLDEQDTRLEAIELRISDIALDTGSGYEID